MTSLSASPRDRLFSSPVYCNGVKLACQGKGEDGGIFLLRVDNLTAVRYNKLNLYGREVRRWSFKPILKT